MKLFKARYKHLVFLYFSLVVAAMATTYFFPEQVLAVFKYSSPIFLILTFILLLTPHAKYQLSHKPNTSTPNFWLRLLGWWGLELGALSIIFVLFGATVIDESLATKTALLTQTSQLYLLSGLFPWPLYLLLGLAFAYFGPKHHLPLIRSTLWPLYKYRVNMIFDLGIDFVVKQAILFIGALTLGLSIAYLIYQLAIVLNIFSSQNLAMSTLLASTLVFVLLANSYWSRITRYFWLKRYPLAIYLVIYSLMVLVIFLLCILGIKLISPFLPPAPLNKLTINWPVSQPILNRWLLLKFCWEVSIAPIVAVIIIKLAQDLNIRMVIFQALLLPVLIGLGLVIDQFWLNHVLLHFLIQITSLEYFGLLFTMISLVLIIIFFRLPESLRLVQLTNKIRTLYPNVVAIRNFLLITLPFLVIYLLSGTPFLIIFLTGLTIPIFLIILWACLNLIIGIK